MLTRPPPPMEGGYSPMDGLSVQDSLSVRPAQRSGTLFAKPFRSARVLTGAISVCQGELLCVSANSRGAFPSAASRRPFYDYGTQNEEPQLCCNLFGFAQHSTDAGSL
jgi:hypothetical protein